MNQVPTKLIKTVSHNLAGATKTNRYWFPTFPSPAYLFMPVDRRHRISRGFALERHRASLPGCDLSILRHHSYRRRHCKRQKRPNSLRSEAPASSTTTATYREFPACAPGPGFRYRRSGKCNHRRPEFSHWLSADYSLRPAWSVGRGSPWGWPPSEPTYLGATAARRNLWTEQHRKNRKRSVRIKHAHQNATKIRFESIISPLSLSSSSSSSQY